MDDSPLRISDVEQAENERARKKEIISELRALVASPGWAYLCTVIEHQRMTVLLSLKEATTLDELIRLNADLREAATYHYLANIAQNIITEFTLSEEAPDDGTQG